MSLDTKLRSFLKKIPLIYWLGVKYRIWQQCRRIENDQKFYEKKAMELGVDKEPSLEEIKNQLKTRLSSRNILVKPKDRNELNIVYASRPVPWDAQNIVPALKKFASVSTYFHSEHGFNDHDPDWTKHRNCMNEHLLNFILELHKKKPIDLILTYYSGFHIAHKTIEELKTFGIVVCTFHLDDRLSFKGRFEGGRWTGPAAIAKAYDLNLTQAPESLVKYRVEGALAMLWPLAANQDLFYPYDVPFKYDVSFVGSAHAGRKPFMEYLKKKGIRVNTFGVGWPNGFIPNEKVPEIFSASRINLNFGNIGHTHYQCGKCRDFEIPMSGGLMLTTHNGHLKDYFEIGKDIFTFSTREECVKQIHRLFADDDLCAKARKSARERALREHTWEHRVEHLLRTIGFYKRKS